MGDNTSDKEEIQCDKHKLNGYFNRDVMAGHHATHAREEEDREREKLRRDAAAAKKAIRDRNEARRNKKNGKDSSKNKAQSSGPAKKNK